MEVLGAVIAISFELLAMILTWIKTVDVVRQFKHLSTAGWRVARSLARAMLYDVTISSLFQLLTPVVLNVYNISRRAHVRVSDVGGYSCWPSLSRSQRHFYCEYPRWHTVESTSIRCDSMSMRLALKSICLFSCLCP